MDVSRALMIKSQYLRLILSGEKTAELRRTPLKSVGWVAVAALGGRGGSPRCIVAVVHFSGCEKVELDALLGRAPEHRVDEADVRAYLQTRAGFLWTISEVRLLSIPVEIPHVKGQVNFAKLDAVTVNTVSANVESAPTEQRLLEVDAYLATLGSEGLPRTSKKRKLEEVAAASAAP